MKKQAINLSWPAQLSDFAKDTTQENFSRGKLKVFYQGETADHRFFSEAFSKEIMKSLPYTPVVSYYDSEEDDFVGHATEQQIYGIVDPCVQPTIVEDDDHLLWCVCDVVLYTERPDMVGEIAQKIVGHSQSLELDPSSVQYKINYDEKKHFKNIEFTAGRFVGLSVLGKNQKPAFTGSSFFSCDDAFEAKMQLLRNYCEQKNDENQNGGNTMNLQEFMKLSWGDVSNKVDEAISNEYANDAYCQLVDMFEDAAIVRFYYYVEGTVKLMKINYTCDENGVVTLGNVTEVRITYEDVNPTTDALFEEVGVENAAEIVEEDIKENSSDVVKEEDNNFINSEEVVEETTATPDEEVDNQVADNAACGDTEPVAEAAIISNAEVTETEKVVDDGNEKEQENDSRAGDIIPYCRSNTRNSLHLRSAVLGCSYRSRRCDFG